MEHSNGTSATGSREGAREGTVHPQHAAHESRDMNHTWENRMEGSEHGMRGQFNSSSGLGEHSMGKGLKGGGEKMEHKAKKMKIYKQMCEKAIDRMSALFGQNVEPHEMTKALMLAVKKGSPEEVVSAIEIFSDYRWAVNEKKELGEEFDAEDED